MALSPGDPNSHSRPEQVLTKHLHFNWDIDFERKTVSGWTTLTCQRLVDGIQTLALDVNMIDIQRVSYNDDQDLKFTIGPRSVCGSSLEVSLPPGCSAQFSLTVYHASSPESPALLWLSPEQTSSKLFPFVFSQGQAILNRALFPCQDTPAVKSSYTAQITADSKLTVLMSALSEGDTFLAESGRREWTFINHLTFVMK